MRGKKAKAIRKHVREKYKFLSDETLYRDLPVLGRSGDTRYVRKIAEACKRHLYLYMKKNYLRIKRAA